MRVHLPEGLGPRVLVATRQPLLERRQNIVLRQRP